MIFTVKLDFKEEATRLHDIKGITPNLIKKFIRDDICYLELRGPETVQLCLPSESKDFNKFITVNPGDVYGLGRVVSCDEEKVVFEFNILNTPMGMIAQNLILNNDGPIRVVLHSLVVNLTPLQDISSIGIAKFGLNVLSNKIKINEE